MPTAFIPTSLRRLSGGLATVEVEEGTVISVIDELEGRFPGFRDALIEDERLRPGVLASVDGEETSWLGTPVRRTSELHFVLAISGG